MTPDTPETLQSALADLRDRHNEAMKSLAKWSIDVDNAVARVAAFEQAQKQADVEPPMLKDWQMENLMGATASGNTDIAAGKRLRFVEAELARLREGLKRQPGDMSDDFVENVLSAGVIIQMGSEYAAREIQRHRKLTVK